MSSQLSFIGNGVPAPEIPEGLVYVDSFVRPEEEKELLEHLDVEHAADWLPDLKRRVQHYGYKYDYAKRRIDQSMKLGPLPDWLRGLADDIAQRAEMDGSFDQAIVNEYEPGQGIAEHIDSESCFGDVVAMLSLASDIELQFEQPGIGARHLQRLRRGSLIILSGPARYEWTHAIVKRQSDPDPVGGKRIERSRRVSITFRSVKLVD